MNKAAASVGQQWSGPRLAMMVWWLGPGACALSFLPSLRTLLDDAHLPCLILFYCAALAIQLLMLGCQPFFRCLEGWCVFVWFPMVFLTLVSIPLSIHDLTDEPGQPRGLTPFAICVWSTLAITAVPPLCHTLRRLRRSLRIASDARMA